MMYLSRDRKTGNYVYRRAVPPELRKAVGKREINRSLGTKDLALAQRRHNKAHLEAEALLRAARTNAAPAVVQERFAAELREQGFHPELGLRDPGVSEIEQHLRVEMLDNMLDRDPWADELRPEEPELINPADQPKVDVLVHGLKALKRRPTLADGLTMYMAEKGRSDPSTARNKRWQDFHRRAIVVFAEGLHHGEQTLIDQVDREDVMKWRDRMVETYAAETVKKHYTTLKAIFGRLYEVLEISRRNPFAKLDIVFQKKELRREKRASFTVEDEALIRSVLPKMNRDAQLVVRLMLATGCRVSEACHLMQQDIVLDGEVPYIHIRPNDRNGLSIKGAFARRVPVVDPEALELLREFPDGPERYQKERGPATASSAINKFLRKNGLTRKRVSLYSARHSMKNKLMAVAAPEYVIDEILGHSDGSAKESYGDGVPPELSAQWLRKALGFEPTANGTS